MQVLIMVPCQLNRVKITQVSFMWANLWEIFETNQIHKKTGLKGRQKRLERQEIKARRILKLPVNLFRKIGHKS